MNQLITRAYLWLNNPCTRLACAIDKHMPAPLAILINMCISICLLPVSVTVGVLYGRIAMQQSHVSQLLLRSKSHAHKNS